MFQSFVIWRTLVQMRSYLSDYQCKLFEKSLDFHIILLWFLIICVNLGSLLIWNSYMCWSSHVIIFQIFLTSFLWYNAKQSLKTICLVQVFLFCATSNFPSLYQSELKIKYVPLLLFSSIPKRFHFAMR